MLIHILHVHYIHQCTTLDHPEHSLQEIIKTFGDSFVKLLKITQESDW